MFTSQKFMEKLIKIVVDNKQMIHSSIQSLYKFKFTVLQLISHQVFFLRSIFLPDVEQKSTKKVVNSLG